MWNIGCGIGYLMMDDFDMMKSGMYLFFVLK